MDGDHLMNNDIPMANYAKSMQNRKESLVDYIASHLKKAQYKGDTDLYVSQSAVRIYFDDEVLNKVAKMLTKKGYRVTIYKNNIEPRIYISWHGDPTKDRTWGEFFTGSKVYPARLGEDYTESLSAKELVEPE